MQVKGSATHYDYKEKIQNPKWRKYLPRTALSWLWHVRLLRSCLSVLKNVFGWSRAQVTDTEWKHMREELHLFPVPCLSHCACSPSPAPTVLPAKSKKIHIYTSLSFTLFCMFCLPLEKEWRREGHTVMWMLPLPADLRETFLMLPWPIFLLIQLHFQAMLKSWLNLHVTPRLEKLTNSNSHIWVRLRPLVGFHLIQHFGEER